MSFREDVREGRKEGLWAFMTTMPMIVLIVVVLTVVFGGIGFFTKMARTAGDRVIIETSFQYKAGMRQEAAILEANIRKLRNKLNYDPDNQNLQNQLDNFEIDLDALRIVKSGNVSNQLFGE